LLALGSNVQICNIFCTWLQVQRAQVVVTGKSSRAFDMEDMSYQEIVRGPPIRHCFYASARIAIRAAGFTESVYTDDLNAFRCFANSTSNDILLDALLDCQSELHYWGRANRVQFDPAKESFYILSRMAPHEQKFTALGNQFDTTFLIHLAVHKCAVQASWRL
jgi:hypothetical protein